MDFHLTNMMILSDFRTVVAFFDCDVLAHQARENLFCWKGFKLLSKKFDTKSIMISQQLARTLKHQIKHTLSLPSLFLMLSVSFSTRLVWMWITTDSVFVVKWGGNNHMILHDITSNIRFPLRCWKRISINHQSINVFFI